MLKEYVPFILLILLVGGAFVVVRMFAWKTFFNVSDAKMTPTAPHRPTATRSNDPNDHLNSLGGPECTDCSDGLCEPSYEERQRWGISRNGEKKSPDGE